MKWTEMLALQKEAQEDNMYRTYMNKYVRNDNKII